LLLLLLLLLLRTAIWWGFWAQEAGLCFPPHHHHGGESPPLDSRIQPFFVHTCQAILLPAHSRWFLPMHQQECSPETSRARNTCYNFAHSLPVLF